jgi:hypothetical protein
MKWKWGNVPIPMAHVMGLVHQYRFTRQTNYKWAVFFQQESHVCWLGFDLLGIGTDSEFGLDTYPISIGNCRDPLPGHSEGRTAFERTVWRRIP